MLITVAGGVGEAPTALGAFDRALFEAGVANYNLVTLSSVIPTGAEVVQKVRPPADDEEWGRRLYVVMAQQREVEVGRDACAGLGWIQEPETGKGLFVEHYGPSVKQVETQIAASLAHMREYRPEQFGPIEMVTAVTTCEEHPVCAVVVAVYESQPWDTGAQ